MKKFLKELIIFVVPIIVVSCISELLLRNIPNDYSYKKKYLLDHSNDISKLFLGSSHTYYGVNPYFISGRSFNAGYVSQTIDVDYEIIKQFEGDWNSLEYIVIPIDYFTLFSKMANSIESWRVKNYNIYFDMQLSNRIDDNLELLSLTMKSNLIRIFSYYLNDKSFVTSSKLGYGHLKKKQKSLDSTGRTAAKRHSKKDLSRLNENIDIIENLIYFASSKNIKLVFYTHPAFKTYVSNLNEYQWSLTTETITRIVKNNSNCYYFNLLQDQDFVSSDYRDADHLNYKGAKKLSLKLERLLANLNETQ